MSLNASQIELLLALPALDPPAGVTPDFTNPPNMNNMAWFVISFTLLVSTICVFIRAFQKLYIARKVQIEEGLIFIAYLMYWGQALAAYALIYAPGYGIHQWNLHYKDVIQPSYLFLIFGDMYSLILPALKAAILIEWCRILVNGNKTKNPFWWGCVAVGSLQVVWGFACLILLNLQCIPQAKIWEFYLEGTCISLHKIQLASATIQVFSDVVMTVLPQKIIWELQLSPTKKLGVSMIFGLGVFACVSASIRLYSTIQFGTSSDQMYYFGDLAFWCIAEGACGFFILCVPCLPRIIKETAFGKRIQRALGLKRTGHNSKGTMDATASHGADKSMNGWAASSNRSAVKVPTLTGKRMTGWGTTTNAYYEMNEDEVELKDVRRDSLYRSASFTRDGRAARTGSPSEERTCAGIQVTTSTSVVILSQLPEEQVAAKV